VQFPLCPLPTLFDGADENQAGEASLSHLSNTVPNPIADAHGPPATEPHPSTAAVTLPELPASLSSSFAEPGRIFLVFGHFVSSRI